MVIGLFFLATFLGGFTSGLTGFAAGLVVSGIWLQILTPLQTAVLIAAYGIVNQAYGVWKVRHALQWRRILPFVIGGAIGVPLGAYLVTYLNPAHLRIGVGILLIVYSTWMALVRRPPIVTGGGRAADAAVGLIGGVMGGMASLSGPAPAIWAQLRGFGKDEQRGVNQPFNMSVLFLALVSAGVAGFLDRTFLIWAAITVPTTLIGARIGLALYGRINDVQFRYILLGLLCLSGLTLIATSLR